MANSAQLSLQSKFLLRLGLALALIYPPIRAVFDPVSWLAYFPWFIRELPISDLALLHGFGVFEIILAIWILSGKRVFWPSLVAGLLLLGIVLSNFGEIDVVFRDISLALIAFALAIETGEKKDNELHDRELGDVDI